MPKYNFKLDMVRALAILGVVAIHVWYPIYSRPDFLGGFSWWLSYIINSVSRVAVPWFLLVSGALLLPRRPRNEIRDVAGRLFRRLGLPLVFWSVVYFWWDHFYYGRLIFFDQAVYQFFTGGIFHLYFLVILFGLYLFLPLLRGIKITRPGLIISFSVGLFIYALQFFLYRDRPILNFFTLWLPYLGYFLAGPFLLNLPGTFSGKKLAWIAGGLSFLSTVIFGYINLALLRRGITTFWGVGGAEYATNFLSPNIIIMSLAGFYLVVHGGETRKRYLRKIINSVARASLGIYLIHMLVIDVLDKYFGMNLDHGYTRLWFYGSYKLELVFFVSYLASVIIARLPLVKALIGEKKWF